MSISSLLRVMLVKRETTSGVDAAPVAATDAVLCRSIVPSEIISIAGVDRTYLRAFFGSFQQLQGTAYTKIEVEVEITGFGTAGPAAPTAGYDALLRSCGLSRTITAGTSVVYAPASTALETVTVWFYEDGRLFKGIGCVGDMTMSMTVGEIPVYKFTLDGLFVPMTDASIVTPTLTAYQTPVLVNPANTSAVQVHGYSALLADFQFALGNQVERRELVGSPGRVIVTGRQSTGTIEIEDTRAGEKNFLTDVAAATLGNFSITHGPATNRVTFASSRMQLLNPRMSDVQNIVHATYDMRFVPSNAGGDEFTLSIL